MVDKKGITDKLPPQSIEAEKSLLGCLMIDKNAIVKVIDSLQPKDFYKKTHQEIYQSIADLFEKGEAIDFLSVSSRLKDKKLLEEIGGDTYLTELVNSVPNSFHILEYAKIVQRKRILRDLIDASYEIGQMGYDETEDVDVLLDNAEKKVFSISQKSLTQRFITLKEQLEQAFERIDNLSKHKGTPRGTPTGFHDLDNLLSGLQKSDLVILASRPSIGKSSLALDIARNITVDHKIPTGIFSLEMSKDQIVDRLISSQAGVDLWRLRTGHLSSEGPDNDFKRIQHALGVLSEAPMFIDDAATSNVLQMRAMARRLQSDQPLGLIIVDYLQLMEPRSSNVSMVQQMTEVSRSLKTLAKELNVPVLALSQLSRAVEQRSPAIPRLSDLRESGCLLGDTLIARADTGERIRIEKLVGKKNIPVYSLDENWQIKKKMISKVFSSGRKMVYELKLRSGFTIKASANHPFRRLDNWVRLDQLKIGDSIAAIKEFRIEKPKNSLNKNEIILLAHLLGDGCVLPRQPIHYTSADEENINVVAKSAKKLFKIKPRIIRQKNWWHVYLPSPYPLARGRRHPITNWFKDLEIKPTRSWNKIIPPKVFTLDNENLSLFLKHLWSTDGSITIRKQEGKSPQPIIYYSTTSPRLAEGVKHLLLRFGIRSSIGQAIKGNYRPCYNLYIQGKEHKLKFLKEIGCFGKRGCNIPQFIEEIEKIKPNTNLDLWPKETWHQIVNPIREDQNISWRKFQEGIGSSYCGSSLFKSAIGTQRLLKIADFLQSQKIYNVANSNIFWDEIVSVKPLGIEEVYDATVPETHNFVANDIIVHNSIEQDADVVLFIYREEKYKPDTLRKGIADIIVAKHRNGPVGQVELYFDEPIASFRTLEKREFDEGEEEIIT